jgi:hypothetical protein
MKYTYLSSLAESKEMHHIKERLIEVTIVANKNVGTSHRGVPFKCPSTAT